MEAAGQLGELAGKTGITSIELAVAFVLRHPAISSAIIGPRTMEHLESQLTAASTVLAGYVLGRIDEIVPPGLTLNPADNGWVSPAWRRPRGAADLTSSGRSRSRGQPRETRPETRTTSLGEQTGHGV